MSETLIGAIIGAGASIIGSAIGMYANFFIQKNNMKSEIKQEEHRIKRERLDKIYEELISIINLYPTLSPNDVLSGIEYPPKYFNESFDSILKTLEDQYGNYKERLNNKNKKSKERANIETQISNIEYSKEKILEISNKYFNAKAKYHIFSESHDKATFDLYSGQDVRDCLVEFEVLIHNIFISGSVMSRTNVFNSRIELCRKHLIDIMRKDLGISRSI